jgi:hypothetical protein
MQRLSSCYHNNLCRGGVSCLVERDHCLGLWEYHLIRPLCELYLAKLLVFMRGDIQTMHLWWYCLYCFCLIWFWSPLRA